MPDVELPDGTIIQDVPEGTTKSELMRKLGRMGDELKLSPQPTAGGTFAAAAGTRFANNALGVPDLLLTLGLRTALGKPLLDREPTTEPPEGVEFHEPLIRLPGWEEAQQRALTGRQMVDLPEVGDRVLPIPRLPETSDEIRDRFPKATMGGEIAGDIATVLSGRAGARSAISKAPARTGRELVPYIEPGVKKQLDNIVSSTFRSHLPRGVARAAETGFEAAALAALQNGDPVESGAYAAGIQAGGSMMQTMAKPLMTNKGLAMAVFMGYYGLQAAQNLIPGGSPDTLDSISTAVTKTIGVFTLGALAAAAGTSRVRGNLVKNMPNFADAVTAIPRTTWVSLVNDLLKDETGNTQRVVEQFAQNPEQFGPGAMVRIERAMKSGTLSDEVEELMKIPDFARQVLRNDQTEEAIRSAQVSGL